jgi:hypothetical protein
MVSNGGFDEEATIGNFWTDTIYSHDFKDGLGKVFNIVTEEDGEISVEYEPPPTRNRIKLTVTFVRASGEIKEVTLKKFKQYTTRGVSRWEEQFCGPGEPMRFTHFTFEKLLGFLKLLTELDLANLNERRIALRDTGGGSFDAEMQAKMRSLLKQPDGLALIDELLRNGSITSRDLVNIGYRKSQLVVFNSLLRDPENAYSAYRAEHGISDSRPEKIWQHFFEKNEWIFGFGLDYRFLSLLQREAHVSNEDIAGRDGVIVDFLMGATNFTVLVEIKRPDTSLFVGSKNSSGSWRLSSDLIDSVSQILAQKASWQVKSEANASDNYNTAGELIRQKTVDPKSILIVGSDSQFSGAEKERAIKLRTFELFRRDSRNIEILTYDELYERATFIVGHSNPK